MILPSSAKIQFYKKFTSIFHSLGRKIELISIVPTPAQLPNWFKLNDVYGTSDFRPDNERGLHDHRGKFSTGRIPKV